MTCKDEEFKRYVERKWSDHGDMTRQLTLAELMEFALKRYQTSVEQQTWGVDAKQTKCIMNLTAKVGNINKWKKELAKGNKGGDGKNKDKEKKDCLPAEEWRKKKFDEAPKWKKQKPKDLKEVKKVKDNTYHWCTFHKMWMQHTNDKCRLNPSNIHEEPKEKRQDNKREKGKSAKKEQEKEKDKKVRFAPAAHMAKAESDSDDNY
jgi:hypothetical protein